MKYNRPEEGKKMGIFLDSKKVREQGILIVCYAFLIILAVWAIFPLYWMFSSVIRVPEQVFETPPRLIPRSFSLYNFKKIFGLTKFGQIGFWKYLENSVIISVAATLLSTVIAALAAYSFSHFRGRGGQLASRSILLAYMFPPIFFLIPLFKMLNSFHLIDTKLGLTIAFLAWSFPYATWLLIAYFSTIPRELEEAAFIDGASHFAAFSKIIVPLAAPGVAAAAVFCFINAWRDFLFAFVLSSTNRSKTLAVGLYEQIGGELMIWPDILTWSALTTLPILIFFLILQKKIISGLTAGAVKG